MKRIGLTMLTMLGVAGLMTAHAGNTWDGDGPGHA